MIAPRSPHEFAPPRLMALRAFWEQAGQSGPGSALPGHGRCTQNPWISPFVDAKSLIVEVNHSTGYYRFSTGGSSGSTGCRFFSTRAFFSRRRLPLSISLFLKKKREEISLEREKQASTGWRDCLKKHPRVLNPIHGFSVDRRGWVFVVNSISYVCFDGHPRVHGLFCLWSTVIGNFSG